MMRKRMSPGRLKRFSRTFGDYPCSRVFDWSVLESCDAGNLENIGYAIEPSLFSRCHEPEAIQHTTPASEAGRSLLGHTFDV